MSSTEVCLPVVRAERGFLTRALQSATRLEAGEAAAALLCAANLSVLLASYYLLKTVREALILSEAGAAVKSYSAAGQALLLLMIVPLYSAVASKITRSALITWVTLFFVSHLAIFYVLGRAGVQIGVVFFLWLGVFNVLVIAQFWAFANDLHDSESGKRAFPVIGIGSALGAWLGARLAQRLFGFLDAYQLILLAAAGLLVSVIVARMVDRNSQKRPAVPSGLLRNKGGLHLVLSDRHLFLIALMVLLFNLVNSLGEYMLGQMVVANAKAAVSAGAIASSQMRETIGSFYGNFFGWVNFVTLLLQIFVVSRVFNWIGVQGALFVLPVIALGTYGLTAALPVLAIVKIAKVLENSSDYSIQNTARHALFLPASPEQKYKAKAAIDTFFWRLGDMLQAGLVLAGTHLAFSTRAYALVNVALIAVWLIVIAGICRGSSKLA